MEHRFENVSSTGNLGVAPDTMTGDRGRTWPWVYKNESHTGGLDTLPTYYELYKNEPPEIEGKP